MKLPVHDAPIVYPAIVPVPVGTPRPFWSVMIPTYNRLAYLEQTVRSVLAQDPGPERMQIDVVDNCTTTGDVEALVRSVAGTRVGYFRQERNLGMVGNWNTCVQRATGRWIHLLGDDDLVLPGFYQLNETLISRYPEATIVGGPAVMIDESGRVFGMTPSMQRDQGPVPDFPVLQASSNQYSTPSAVISRAAYEMVGGFTEAFTYVPDWDLFFRVAVAGVALNTNLPYTLYRMHGQSLTTELSRNGRTVAEAVRLTNLLADRLPQAQRKQLHPTRRPYVAGLAYITGNECAAAGEYAREIRYRRLAYEHQPGLRNLVTLARSVGRWMIAPIIRKRARGAPTRSRTI